MGTSVPYFRLAVREVSGRSKKTYADGYRLDDVNTHASAMSRNRTVVASRTKASCQADNWSDQSILRDAKDRSNAIIQTNEFIVEYHGDDSNSQESAGELSSVGAGHVSS
jgi:S-formylglutathione hydrolase FrmB